MVFTKDALCVQGRRDMDSTEQGEHTETQWSQAVGCSTKGKVSSGAPPEQRGICVCQKHMVCQGWPKYTYKFICTKCI